MLYTIEYHCNNVLSMTFITKLIKEHLYLLPLIPSINLFLQALAVQQSLNLSPSEDLNTSVFVDNLIKKMNKIEADQSED